MECGKQGSTCAGPTNSVPCAYLVRLAAFHFAQRARCSAAIRLRAAADTVLRFLPSIRARPTLLRDPLRLPERSMLRRGVQLFSELDLYSLRNCKTTLARCDMVSLGQEL